ncbi:MAG: Glyoxylate carboligase (EC [uncultured Caballeronia sp.]|nr:MAG: Glyoxylate carboligase (EC [uncultured Caballeronia sp.]
MASITSQWPKDSAAGRVRVFNPEDLAPALRKAQGMLAEFGVPIIVEVILERVTNIAIDTEIDCNQRIRAARRKPAGRAHDHRA